MRVFRYEGMKLSFCCRLFLHLSSTKKNPPWKLVKPSYFTSDFWSLQLLDFNFQLDMSLRNQFFGKAEISSQCIFNRTLFSLVSKFFFSRDRDLFTSTHGPRLKGCLDLKSLHPSTGGKENFKKMDRLVYKITSFFSQLESHFLTPAVFFPAPHHALKNAYLPVRYLPGKAIQGSMFQEAANEAR